MVTVKMRVPYSCEYHAHSWVYFFLCPCKAIPYLKISNLFLDQSHISSQKLLGRKMLLTINLLCEEMMGWVVVTEASHHLKIHMKISEFTQTSNCIKRNYWYATGSL